MVLLAYGCHFLFKVVHKAYKLWKNLLCLSTRWRCSIVVIVRILVKVLLGTIRSRSTVVLGPLLVMVFELISIKVWVSLDLLTDIIQLVKDGYKLAPNLSCLFRLRLRVLCWIGITPICSLSDSSHPVDILQSLVLVWLHAEHYLALFL